MVQQIISPETFSLSFKTFFSFAWHKKFRFSSLGNLRFLIFINKITFFFKFRRDIYWENTWDYIYMRRGHGVYWTSYEMGSLSRRGQAICNWVYLLLSCKAAIVNFIKAEFLRNTNLFQITIPPARIPFCFTFIEASESMPSKILYLYDLRNMDFHFFSGTRKTKLKARSFIFQDIPLLKWACLLKYNVSS